ncbi:MAG TPA: hypothetical protein VJG30_01485 [Candidatus Nanoarchaeia archaeon]|nr:hypothetical protein [Candidatus Nanoarchaeia archaeon]
MEKNLQEHNKRIQLIIDILKIICIIGFLAGMIGVILITIGRLS